MTFDDLERKLLAKHYYEFLSLIRNLSQFCRYTVKQAAYVRANNVLSCAVYDL